MAKDEAEKPNMTPKTTIVLTEFEDGTVDFALNSTGKVSIPNVIGILETAKLDVHREHTKNKEFHENFVTVKLEQFDLDNDNTGFFKKNGHKVGDEVTIPKQMAELREQAMQNMKTS